jgi:hypothetical protein
LENPGPIEAPTPVVEEVKAVSISLKKNELQNDSLFGLIMNFNNESLGDRIKTLAFLFIVIFIIYHYFYYRSIQRKFNDFEIQIKVLENLLKEADGVARKVEIPE